MNAPTNINHKTKSRQFQIKDIKQENRLFYSALALYVLSYALGNTNIGMVAATTVLYGRIGMQIVALFLLVSQFIFFFRKYSKIELVILCAGLVLLFVCYMQAGRDTMPFVWTMLFVFAAKDNDIRFAAVVFLAVQSGVLVFTAIGSQVGLIPDVVWVDEGVEVKRSLGFNHPNMLGVVLFSIASAFAIVREGRLKLADVIIYLAIALLLFGVARARTSEIGFVVLLVLLLLNLTRISKKKLMIACYVLFGLVVILSIAIMLFYNSENSLLSTLNSLLSRRFYYWNLYASTYPPTFFGRNFEELPILMDVYLDSSVAFTVDNVYCYTILHLGILAFLFFVGSIIVTLLWSAKTKRCDAAFLAFIAFLLFGFSESHTFWIGMNISLLVVSRCFEMSKTRFIAAIGETK